MRRRTVAPFTCCFCTHNASRPAIYRSNRLRSLSRHYTSTSQAVPSFAPKPHLDIKHIARNPGLYAQNCLDRNYAALSQAPWKILELTQRRTKLQHESRAMRERNNALAKDIKIAQAAAERANKDAQATAPQNTHIQRLVEQARKLKQHLTAVADEEGTISAQLQDLALSLPNLSSTSTPTGTDPDVISIVESHPGALSLTRPGRSHVDIGLDLDLLDFAGAASTSGWGWYFLKNGAALLEHALVHFALTTLAARGWIVVSPPSMVYAHVAAACGFQPRDANGEQQIYAVARPEKDAAKPAHALAATAEIPLAGMMAERVVREQELPMRCVAASRCYRAEAGARGVDTKGLYRVHEFTKVEMFAWTLPDADAAAEGNFATGVADGAAAPSTRMFEEMLSAQREILSALGLSYRELEMPTADLGASASRKRDIEAFFPSRWRAAEGGREGDEGWGEVTSTSICTDYQVRRLGTRYRKRGGQLEWPHTVNGTALAVPRVLAAILEIGWDEASGTVRVPECLRPWMMGMEVIGRRK